MESNKRFLKDAEELVRKIPTLNVLHTESGTIIKGKVQLSSEGMFVDEYEIEIHPVEDYPERYPKVYETGGRLPKNIDWHIYDTGRWCIATDAAEVMDCAGGITLERFVTEQVYGFLFGQVFRYKNGYFFRERSHGLVGDLEYYKELFKVKDFTAALQAMNVTVTRPDLKSTSKCFCGSKKKYKKCHRRQIRLLRKNALPIVKRDLTMIKTFLDNIKNEAA